MIARIDPILLFVRDFQRSLDFYRNVLGLPVKSLDEVHEEFAEFDLGEITFALHGGYEGEAQARHSDTPLALHFWTEDIMATSERLKERGVKFTREPRKTSLGFWEGSFEDPEGNEFGLFQEAEGA
ncbi:MAG: VOC family protein [Anaerolineae bacterium]